MNMVTTRAQAKRHHSSTASKNGSRPESIEDKEVLLGSIEENEVLSVDRNPQGECNAVSNPIEEDTEPRRDELPTSTFMECNPLEANADDIRQWQATDPTLAKVRDDAGRQE